jgi:RNA polymerase sigma-70 factor, ECF subfamily
MDEQAFHACYRRTAGPLRNYAARVLGSATYADDIVQESYLRLLRMPSPPEDPGELRALLMRIASNLIVDVWRKHSRESLCGVRLQEDHSRLKPAPTSDDPLRIDMRRLFQRLRPRDRQLLWLAHVEGSTHHEIAQALGLRPWSVRVLLSRARRKLAKLLEATGHLPEKMR